MNRKKIEVAFADEISKAYAIDGIRFEIDDFHVFAPRWFFRDLGILETDLILVDNKLKNIVTKRELILKRVNKKNAFQIGDLEYRIDSDNPEIDLGLLARQPKLWAGNPALINFSPCKDGWDIPLRNISQQAFIPWDYSLKSLKNRGVEYSSIKDKKLVEASNLIIDTIFAGKEEADDALDKLVEILKRCEYNLAELIRRRLESLARSSDESIRCKAYRILLSDGRSDPSKSYLPAFIESGLNFLNAESIEIISDSNIEKRRLQALRVRLQKYRENLKWPANFIARQQFVSIFRLLVNFADKNPEFYNPVRIELCNWILHREDPELSKIALELLRELANNYERNLLECSPALSKSQWEDIVVFDEELSEKDVLALKKALFSDTFLTQSIALAYDEYNFRPDQLKSKSVWASKIKTRGDSNFYRISAKGADNKQFEIQVVLGEGFDFTRQNETIFNLIKISGYPEGARVLPKLGCVRPELFARSMAWKSELSVWDRIRNLSSEINDGIRIQAPNELRKLFTAAFTAFFTAWRNSDCKIVPGLIIPDNVVASNLDFAESGTIMSISSWKRYDNPLDLVLPMIKNFYHKTAFHYPWADEELKISWIFDACMEALGEDRAYAFLTELRSRIMKIQYKCPDGADLSLRIVKYLDEYSRSAYLPIALLNAIERYKLWFSSNYLASAGAKESMIKELYEMYKLSKYSEYMRYYLYRHTYFLNSDDLIKQKYDILLNKMAKSHDKSALQLIELSDLLNSLHKNTDRELLNRVIFPSKANAAQLSIEKISESANSTLIVKTYLQDKHGVEFCVRPALNPSEVGNLYRLYFKQNIAVQISEYDKRLLLVDKYDRVVGGIIYRESDTRYAKLESIIIDTQYKNRGLARALASDFADRMQAKSYKGLQTHYYLEKFFKKIGYKEDKNWGALILNF
jgi:hypothetical protein